jgi:hypothetical protein
MMKDIYMKITVIVTYLGMIIVNALANILPINGIRTGEVSDSYANLFAPAGITFSIWGLIYLLLGAYIVYQFFSKNKLINKIGIYFIITSIANILWIFSWHYDLMFVTLIFMAVILFYLIKIADLLRKEKFDNEEKILILLPFSVYFGWITIATIANVTTFLVSINWNGFGLSEQFWTISIILIGTLIGLLRMFYDKNIAYGLVFVWAYIGIWIKHATVFNYTYMSIIITTISCIVLFCLGIIYILVKDKIKLKV